MPKILLGWEFGGGLGHLTTLLPIAKGLADRCEPVFAVKNLGRAAGLLADQGDMLSAASLLQAPTWPPLTDPAIAEKPAFTLADIMLKNHFHDPTLLYGIVRGWRGILRLVDPVLVLADYSPGLLLAARGSVPTIALGPGYTTPPPGRPLPPIRRWAKELPESSKVAERQILRAVNEVQGRLGRPPVAFLGDLFNGDKTFAFTIPELDTYDGSREVPPLPPFNVPTFDEVRPVGARPEGRIFAYLPGNNPRVVTTLEALRKLRLSGDLFIPGLPETIRQHFASSSLTFHDRPAPLEAILPEARIVIHHGGHAMCYAALRAGTPQLLLISNLEKLVNAYGLDQLGCAVILNADGKLEVEAMVGYLRRLLDKEEIHRAADDTARRLAAQLDPNSFKTVLEACEQALA